MSVAPAVSVAILVFGPSRVLVTAGGDESRVGSQLGRREAIRDLLGAWIPRIRPQTQLANDHAVRILATAVLHLDEGVAGVVALVRLGTGPSPRIAPMLEATLYDQVGGIGFFERLVDRFYDGVQGDPLLRAVYPDEDLGPARHRLTLFLIQYWGGPTTYDEERGHPRLRMRHAPFAIGVRERDRWLTHMRAAIDASQASAEVRERLHAYMTMAADSMRNRTD